METIIIAALAGAIIGALLTFLYCSGSASSVKSALEANLRALEDKLENQGESHTRETAALREAADRMESQYRERMADERAAADRRLAEADRQWQLRLDRMKEEILNLNNTILLARQEKLQDSNRRQMAELLKPVKEQFDSFRKSVEATRTAGEVNKEELKHSFEAAMRLFAQQQEQTVKHMREQTDLISREAQSLTRVLRHDTKTQGDWGEMILETLLESSGLERDTHYFVQENVKDADGQNFRPDVIVRFPDGRAVIVDSKVSLTAYAAAFDSDDEAFRKLKLREHARSVKRHIDELVTKDYNRMVSNSIGMVLMFIPNDQCYLAAVEQDKDLTRYAYSKGIVIVSPCNLMIALQLVYNMWQHDRQTKNVEAIVRTATELYEKVAVFSSTMEDIENHIARLGSLFAKAKDQLLNGNGNILRRVENLKNLGITPKKNIKGLD